MGTTMQLDETVAEHAEAAARRLGLTVEEVVDGLLRQSLGLARPPKAEQGAAGDRQVAEQAAITALCSAAKAPRRPEVAALPANGTSWTLPQGLAMDRVGEVLDWLEKAGDADLIGP